MLLTIMPEVLWCLEPSWSRHYSSSVCDCASSGGILLGMPKIRPRLRGAVGEEVSQALGQVSADEADPHARSSRKTDWVTSSTGLIPSTVLSMPFDA